MQERPRLSDSLGLVALPSAVTCGRLFVQYTLANWGVSPFVVADAMVIASELVTMAVQETGVLDEVVRWSELDVINRVVVRLLGFSRHIVIEVWDAATEPAVLPADEPVQWPTGLHLIDVTARRWASTASPRGRLSWAELAVYDRTESGLPIRQRRRTAWPPPSPPTEPTDGEGHDDLLRRIRDGLKRL